MLQRSPRLSRLLCSSILRLPISPLDLNWSVAIDGDNVRFSVSNQGDRTGTLTDAMLRVEPGERACRSMVSFDVRLESEHLQQVLEVGKTSSMSARPSAAVRLPETFIPECAIRSAI